VFLFDEPSPAAAGTITSKKSAVASDDSDRDASSSASDDSDGEPHRRRGHHHRQKLGGWSSGSSSDEEQTEQQQQQQHLQSGSSDSDDCDVVALSSRPANQLSPSSLVDAHNIEQDVREIMPLLDHLAKANETLSVPRRAMLLSRLTSLSELRSLLHQDE